MKKTCNFINKEELMQVFSYKFYEIFANKYLIEYLRATASKCSNQKVSLHIITNPCK